MSNDEKPTPPTFGGEVGGGIGCILFVVALAFLFDIGGFRTAIIRHFFG
jgi:hypothetical protein